jgi:hypothetical protein
MRVCIEEYILYREKPSLQVHVLTACLYYCGERDAPLQLRRSRVSVSLCLHSPSRRLLTPATLQLQFPIVYATSESRSP